jgi:LmbE family N-acetylglucosaminyl deacetylase
MTVAAFNAASKVTQYPEHGLAPWQPSKLYYMAYPRSYILTRYEIMRAMGAKVPADRPDFDPNKVEATPDELITTRVDIRGFLLHKMNALRCHRTQIAPDWWLTRVPREVLRDAFGLEYFTRVVSHVPVDGPEDDLFAGLR